MNKNLLVVVLFLVNCPAWTSPEDRGLELSFSEEMLMDVSLRGDLHGLKLALARVTELDYPEAEARLNYLRAFANWQIAFRGLGQEFQASTHLEEAVARSRMALEKDPKLIEAALVGLLCSSQLAMADPKQAPSRQADIQKFYAAAVAVDANHPGVFMIQGMSQFFMPGGDRSRGLSKMNEGLQQYEKAQVSPEDDDPHQRWWHAIFQSWVGRYSLMLDEPDLDKARAAFARAVELRPDYLWAREAVSGTSQTLTFCPATQVANLKWSALTQDPEGDGLRSGLPDAKSLSLARDASFYWFKFHTSLPNPKAFGINLALDDDGDASNGLKWWGGNSTFYFDTLVTVWVTASKTGNWVGTIGVAGAREAQLGRMTETFRNEIAVSVDAQASTIIVGVPREVFGQKAIRLVGAVGSNMEWSDNLPNQGSILLEVDSPLN